MATHPDGRNVYHYIRDGPWFWGIWLLPMSMAFGEERTKRQISYDWYVKKGLPVPEEFLPKDEQRLLRKRRDYYYYLSNGLPVPEDCRIKEEDEEGMEKSVVKPVSEQPFDPQISMITTSIPGLTQESEQKCMSTVYFKSTDLSNISPAV